MNFYHHLESYLSKEEIVKLETSLGEDSLHGVLLNTRKMSDKEFLSLFPNVIKHPIVDHAYIYKKEEYDLGKSIYHTLGCFYLQEPSAMVPAFLLNASEDDLVLDMCAAPGGKSVQSSFLMNNKGLIISNDIAKSRASIIVDNAERLGLGNIVVTNNDLSLIKDSLFETFDKIILDAPCSGSGMFRKENKMILDWSYNKVLKFAETQKELILLAFNMLKPGGKLCYSTCSFSKEEDEDVIEYLLENTTAEIIEVSNPLFYVNKETPLGVHLFPSLFPGEGHYICLIQKPGDLCKKRSTESKPNKYGLPFKEVYKFGDFLFGLNHEFNFKCFNVLRCGVKVGELIKQEIKYDYHYSHYLDNYEKEYELSDEEMSLFMQGNTINVALEKGYYLLKYKKHPIAFSKNDGLMFKNNLPKIYRHKYEL